MHGSSQSETDGFVSAVFEAVQHNLHLRHLAIRQLLETVSADDQRSPLVDSAAAPSLQYAASVHDDEVMGRTLRALAEATTLAEQAVFLEDLKTRCADLLPQQGAASPSQSSLAGAQRHAHDYPLPAKFHDSPLPAESTESSLPAEPLSGLGLALHSAFPSSSTAPTPLPSTLPACPPATSYGTHCYDECNEHQALTRL